MSRFNLSVLAVRERAITLFLLISIGAAGAFAFLQLGRAEDPDLLSDPRARVRTAHRLGVQPLAVQEQVREGVRLLGSLGHPIQDIRVPPLSPRLWREAVLLEEWEVWDRGEAGAGSSIYAEYVRARFRANRHKVLAALRVRLEAVAAVSEPYENVAMATVRVRREPAPPAALTLHPSVDEAVVAAYREHLLPVATVSPPNEDEDERLGRDHGGTVLRTGGGGADVLHVPGTDPVAIEHPLVETENDHGTGCTYSAALAALLAYTNRHNLLANAIAERGERLREALVPVDVRAAAFAALLRPIEIGELQIAQRALAGDGGGQLQPAQPAGGPAREAQREAEPAPHLDPEARDRQVQLAAPDGLRQRGQLAAPPRVHRLGSAGERGTGDISLRAGSPRGEPAG